MWLWKYREGRGREVMCGASGSLSLRKMLWCQQTWADSFPIFSPLFSTFPLSRSLPSLPLLFCLHHQLLWGCTNLHDLCYRRRQGPGEAEKPGGPLHNWVVPGWHLAFSWSRLKRNPVPKLDWRKGLAPGRCLLAVLKSLGNFLEMHNLSFYPRTTVQVHITLPKHNATDR